MMSYQLQSLFPPESSDEGRVVNESPPTAVEVEGPAFEVLLDSSLKLEKYAPRLLLQSDDLAPMLRQYLEMKLQYEEHLLMFQVGDFYEVFYADAIEVAEILHIRLTSRDKNKENPVPMCGVPIHAIDNYIPKILEAGRSCVLVSQIEGPTSTASKTSIRREVSRIVTPGIRLENETLDETEFRFLASLLISARGDGGCFCFADVAAGRLFLQPLESADEVEEVLERVRPVELVLPTTHHGRPVEKGSGWWRVAKRLGEQLSCRIVMRPFPLAEQNLQDRLSALLPKEIADPEVLSLLKDRECQAALQALLDYISEVTFSGQVTLGSVAVRSKPKAVVVDAVTRRNLEITETRLDGDRRKSLFAHMNATKTPMGARLLSDWLLNPSDRLSEIVARHEAVQEFFENDRMRMEYRRMLSTVRDLDRLAARLGTLRATPHDLGLLRDSLAELPGLFGALESLRAERISQLRQQLDVLSDVSELLSSALVAEPPVRLADGPIIADEYHVEIAELRKLQNTGSDLLLELEQRERVRTGIPGLKIKYNSVFGYFIEVSKAHLAKIPKDYERRQTVANAERFITPELKHHEQKTLSARSRLFELERQVFAELRQQVALHLGRLQITSALLAELDVYSAFAHVARESDFVRPKVVEAQVLDVVAARHPVVERVLGAQNFIPNDIRLGSEGSPDGAVHSRRFSVLTGANMGGKSTYLRTIGIVQLLTQAGSFVPARRATVGIVDRIFTRIGAADDLARGDSTFMVEMRESATIVSRATSASLVLIDEVGRGTATNDGLALAQALAEWLYDRIQCRTVFATHFHELTALVQTMPDAFCLSVGVLEQAGEIIFTHRIEERPASRSYGLEVARLAGLPEGLLERAQELLRRNGIEARNLAPELDSSRSLEPVPVLDPAAERLLESLGSVEVDRLTPLQSLNELAGYGAAARALLLARPQRTSG